MKTLAHVHTGIPSDPSPCNLTLINNLIFVTADNNSVIIYIYIFFPQKTNKPLIEMNSMQQ